MVLETENMEDRIDPTKRLKENSVDGDVVNQLSDQVATNLKLKDLNKKRENYLDWSEYFMAVAFLSAMRSKDPCSQVGACIINSENRIVGVGYNGMPIGCSDDLLPWSKSAENKIDTKYMYVCHAEMNAIMNKNSADLKGCILYVALFPCNECAKLIIQSGIKEVIYMSDKHKEKPETKASKLMFNMANVKFHQFIPKRTQILIDFDEIDWNSTVQK